MELVPVKLAAHLHRLLLLQVSKCTASVQECEPCINWHSLTFMVNSVAPIVESAIGYQPIINNSTVLFSIFQNPLNPVKGTTSNFQARLEKENMLQKVRL